MFAVSGPRQSRAHARRDRRAGIRSACTIALHVHQPLTTLETRERMQLLAGEKRSRVPGYGQDARDRHGHRSRPHQPGGPVGARQGGAHSAFGVCGGLLHDLRSGLRAQARG
jgi:hypothetical protein